MKKILFFVIFSFGIIFTNAFNASAQSVDLSEYLRLEVISDTLYKRSKQSPDWEKLMRPNWSDFRQSMNEFIINSFEVRIKKADPPNGYLSPKIDWEKLGHGNEAIDFKRVPDPWFNLQADIIRKNMVLVDKEFEKEVIDEARMTEFFLAIKNAVLYWPRPPLALGIN